MNIIGIIALVIVVASLTAYVVWRLLHNNAQKGNNMPATNNPSSNIIADKDINNRDIVALSMALHLYLNDSIHDDESNVITIKRIQRRYSPWSSKIYSMNNFQ